MADARLRVKGGQASVRVEALRIRGGPWPADRCRHDHAGPCYHARFLRGA